MEKLGEEGLRPGEMRLVEQVRYGVFSTTGAPPRDLRINVALCWRIWESRARNPRRRRPEEPWYLASRVPRGRAKSAVSWYWQRGGWIEQSLKRLKGPLRAGRGVRVGTPAIGWGGCSWRSPSPSGGSRSCRCARKRRAVGRGLSGSGKRLGEGELEPLLALWLLEGLGNLALRCLPQPLHPE